MATTMANTQESAVNVNTLDSLLDDLDLDGVEAEPIEEVIEAAAEDQQEEVIEPSAELADDDLRNLEADMTREEVYAEQAPTTDVDTQAPAEAKKTKRTKKADADASAPKTPAQPRAPRDLASLDEAVFQLEDDVAADKAAVMATIPTQKKIAEKFENLFGAISAGRKPSTYITQAFALLETKGAVTTADIVAAYKTPGAKSPTEGYNEGTARSQCGQIMNLFATVKIATRNGQALTLNPKSTLAAKLRKIGA